MRGRRHVVVLSVVASIVALAAAFWAAYGMRALLSGSGSPAPPPVADTFEPDAGADEAGSGNEERRLIANGLQRGVERAASTYAGSVEAAVMLADWSSPVVRRTGAGRTPREMRAWSISKVVTAVALLHELDWGDDPGAELSSEVDAALRGAFIRSENCRQRRLVLELQRAVGGSAERARSAVLETIRNADARIDVPGTAHEPEPDCVDFLSAEEGVADPMEAVPLFGTATWNAEDAVRFTHALGAGTYGTAVRSRLVGLMREPKERSTEIDEADYTAPLEWGAGRALAGFNPAHKAGWGGTEQESFVAAQVALIEAPGGGLAALSVAFWPSIQPERDDPGQTTAIEAIETVMETLGRRLERLE